MSTKLNEGDHLMLEVEVERIKGGYVSLDVYSPSGVFQCVSFRECEMKPVTHETLYYIACLDEDGDPVCPLIKCYGEGKAHTAALYACLERGIVGGEATACTADKEGNLTAHFGFKLIAPNQARTFDAMQAFYSTIDDYPTFNRKK